MNAAIDDLNPDLRLGVQAYSFLAVDKGPGAYAFGDFADIINARYDSPNARSIADAFRAAPDGVLTVNANRTVSVELPDLRGVALRDAPEQAQDTPAARGAQAGAKKEGQGEDKAPPRDFRQEFTDKVVAAIESGSALPWNKPWHTLQGLPRNAVTGKTYSGGNRVVLGLAAMEKGYTDPRWMTVKQSNDLGGHVRKGEKGVLIERWDEKPFWKRDDVELKLGERTVKVDAKRGVDAEGVHLVGGQVVSPERITVRHEQRTGAGVIVRDYTWKQAERDLKILVGRGYVVFNAEQCEGLKLAPIAPRQNIPAHERAERLMDVMQKDGARFLTQGTQAYYSPAGDLIVLPPRDTFKSVEGYYGTALHEMGHATGAEKRLNRDGITGKHAFGSEGYAKEELRAELFSAFMAAETGIPHDDDNHQAYLQSWAKALKNDKNEIFRAAAEAGKAVDYVLDKEQALQITQERQASVDAAEKAAMRAAEPAAPGTGLTLISPDQIRPGIDLVDEKNRMSRVLTVERAPAGTTTTTEQDLDTGARRHMTYWDGDEIVATTLSLNLKNPEQAVSPEPQQGKLKTVEIDAPAHWASALVNRDESGLEASEAASVKDWVKQQGVGWPVSASETFTGRHDGLLTEMATYTFLVPEKALGPSVASGVHPGKADSTKRPPTMHEALEADGWTRQSSGSYKKTFLLDKDRNKGGEFTRGQTVAEKILFVKPKAVGFVVEHGWEDISVPVKTGLSPAQAVAELDKAAKEMLMAEHGKSLGVTSIRGKGEPDPANPETAAVLAPTRSGKGGDMTIPALRSQGPFVQPHEMTFAEFSQTAAAQKLGPNHGREWQIMQGNQFMGFAEGPTAEDALRMMHKNKVNNALYDNMPDAVRPPDMEPKSMPPARVLDEYPDLQTKFAPAIEEHRQMLAKEDRKASEHRAMTVEPQPPQRRSQPRREAGIER